MNSLEYYNRQSDPWGQTELEQVRQEYETNEMTISEIADIHHRTPGSISYKLKNLGLITHNTLSRGYSDYKKSDLYREIVQSGKKKDNEKKMKKEAKEAEKAEKAKETAILRSKNTEIAELKTEIIGLKKDVKEMLRLIHELYAFETN